MPELPEVETMVRGLRPALVGHRVVEGTIHDAFLLQTGTAEEFSDRLAGAGVAGVDRRGKWVVIALSPGRGLVVVQPRMTGGFRVVEPERSDYVRMSFRMDGPAPTVWFCDTRRLGKIAWYPDADAAELAFRRSHGPDALEIGRDDLAAGLRRTGRAIKPTLMDQKIVAGIGNIYADEILFQARVHPERKASALKAEEVGRIHAAIWRVLDEAIAAEGSSFDVTYLTPTGGKGGFLSRNAMYGRGGLPCPSCGEAVLKTKIAGLVGRPTHYCGSCQVLRPARRAPRKG